MNIINKFVKIIIQAAFFIIIFNNNIYAQELSINNRLDCSIQAAIKYGVPVDILLAISSIENGQPGKAYKNKDGSIDYGVMQINSIYLKDLKDTYNRIVTPEEILNNTCYAFEIAAFKISEHLKNDDGSFLKKIANYHSKTPDLNRNYQTKLIQHSSIWRKYLKQNKYTVYQWSYADLKEN